MHSVDQHTLEHKAQKPLTDAIGHPDVFYPERFPIISRHWFGISPAPTNATSAGLVVDPPFRRQIELLSAKGPRLPVELLAELAVEYGLEVVIREKIARYLNIPNAALDITGARQLPPPPLHTVQGENP